MAEINTPHLIVITGPTASGKSDLAIALARKYGGEIVSADSRQVYRGMDIGTGKVTKKEQGLVRHWLLDIASPKRQYSVARWKKEAQKAIRDIARRGKTPIICGGTGFWIDALVYDAILPDVRPDAVLRAQLETLSTDQLYADLSVQDPARAVTIDRHNRRRLIRALEIIKKTKQPVPLLQFQSPYDTLYLVLVPDKSTLDERITKRLDKRLKTGMIREVQRLHDSGVSWKKLEGFGLEYLWVSHYLQKEITREQMREGLLRAIIQYAKRQRTWFRRNPNAIWIDGPDHAERLVKRFLNR